VVGVAFVDSPSHPFISLKRMGLLLFLMALASAVLIALKLELLLIIESHLEHDITILIGR
jgi:hypothetical protein